LLICIVKVLRNYILLNCTCFFFVHNYVSCIATRNNRQQQQQQQQQQQLMNNAWFYCVCSLCRNRVIRTISHLLKTLEALSTHNMQNKRKYSFISVVDFNNILQAAFVQVDLCRSWVNFINVLPMHFLNENAFFAKT